MTGFSPAPFFIKVTGLPDLPVAVSIIGVVEVSVCPAVTLKSTPPSAIVPVLSASTADAIVG
jgi:hypothetical protein